MKRKYSHLLLLGTILANISLPLFADLNPDAVASPVLVPNTGNLFQNSEEQKPSSNLNLLVTTFDMTGGQPPASSPPTTSTTNKATGNEGTTQLLNNILNNPVVNQLGVGVKVNF